MLKDILFFHLSEILLIVLRLGTNIKKREGNIQLFSTFIESIYPLDFLFFSQEYYLHYGQRENKKVSFVGRYENFNNDFSIFNYELDI